MTIEVLYKINISPEELIDKVSFGFQSIGYVIAQRKEEMERISAEKPWYKANLQRAKELGFEADEVLHFGIESVRSTISKVNWQED